MNEFSLNGKTYRTGVLDARSQFHIARRLAPFLSALAPVMADVASAAGSGGNVKDSIDKAKMSMKPEDLTKIVPAFGDALASMDDATADYIVFGLLAGVTIQEANGLGWAPITKDQTIMYGHIDMMTMIMIAAKVMMVNFSGFFGVLDSLLNPAGQKASGQ